MTDSILRSYQSYSTTTMVPFPAPPFSISSPLDIPGLLVWFDATDSLYHDTPPTVLCADTETVFTWKDKSANAYVPNDAGFFNRNTFKLASNINNKPAMRGVAGGGIRVTTPGFDFLSSNIFSFWAVCTISASSDSNARIVSYQGNGQADDFGNANSIMFLRSGAAAAVQVFANSAGGTPLDPGAHTITYDVPFRFSVVADGTNATSYVNNSDAKTTLSYSALNLQTGAFAISNTTGAANSDFGGGDISEIIISTSAVSSAYRIAVDAYLVTKWGF